VVPTFPSPEAAIHAGLADNDRAFAWLERAVSAHDSFIFNLDYPPWDPIRADRRFVALCERLNTACARLPIFPDSRART